MNHYEKLNLTISNLGEQAQKLHSLTQIYEKTDEIQTKFTQNLNEITRLQEIWAEFSRQQKTWQENMVDENKNYFDGFQKIGVQVSLLTQQIESSLVLFSNYKEIIDKKLQDGLALQEIFQKNATNTMDNHLQRTEKLQSAFAASLDKLSLFEQFFQQNEKRNSEILQQLETTINSIRSEIYQLSGQANAQILDNLSNLSARTNEMLLQLEQTIQKQDLHLYQNLENLNQKLAQNNQTQLAFLQQNLENLSQKLNQNLEKQDILLAQSLENVAQKLQQSAQFSQAQMRKSDEMFQNMQIRLEEKNTFFAKQITDNQEINSRFASSAEEKLERITKDNRKFYGDLEDALRVRIDQLKADFQLKVREELDANVLRNENAVRTQLGNFQNQLDEKAEARSRNQESKINMLLIAVILNFFAVLFLIFTR